ncbi:hypothetical protein [Candidatus Tisiphia endosymbiont of Oplodontha viridula]|uniref:hypothetical protein n=1 Tax=Candidatus Tisiphia endosymbiont of Oplodontha viridula TaxID=3077925 RepID=UPI0035C90AE9
MRDAAKRRRGNPKIAAVKNKTSQLFIWSATPLCGSRWQLVYFGNLRFLSLVAILNSPATHTPPPS